MRGLWMAMTLTTTATPSQVNRTVLPLLLLLCWALRVLRAACADLLFA